MPEKVDLIEKAYKLNISGSVAANKVIIAALGVEAAVLFGELLSRQKYFADRGRLDESGFFFNSRGQLRSATGLGRYTQERVFPKLIDAKLIVIKREAGKSKRFKVNVEVAIAMLEKEEALLPAELPEETDPFLKRRAEKIARFELEAEDNNPAGIPPSQCNNPAGIPPTTRLDSSLPGEETGLEFPLPPGWNPATNKGLNNLNINKGFNNYETIPVYNGKENLKNIREIIADSKTTPTGAKIGGS